MFLRNYPISMHMSIQTPLINPIANELIDVRRDEIENLNGDNKNDSSSTICNAEDEESVSVEMKGRNSKAPKRVKLLE